ncbi:MAG: ATP-binding protein [Desulfobacterales bacterium]|nr:ATP-binding protein [Desulfobacterales bacterium]
MPKRTSFFNKGWKGPLAVRQLTYILLFSSLVTLLLSGAQIFIEYKTDLNEVESQLVGIKQGYLETLTSSLWKLDDDQITVVLKDALSHRDIVYLEIREADTVIFRAGNEPDGVGRLTKEFQMIYNDGKVAKPIGHLKAVASLSGIYDRLVKRIIYIFVSQGIKTFLVSFFILYIIYRLVIRHLMDLGRFSRRLTFTEKDNAPFVLRRSERVFFRRDELDDLVTAVNTMQSQVTKDIRNIREKEAVYRQTIETAIDGFWITDDNGKLLDVNKAYSDFTGYNRNHLLNLSFHDLATESPDVIDDWLKTIRSSGSHRFESVHRCNNGQDIHFEISATFSPDHKCFLFLRDITRRNREEEKRHRLEEKLRQSQKMESIGTLAGGIAHDFNNLLVPIMGNTEILMEDIPEQSPLRSHLDEIFAGAVRARDLVHQILTFSKQGEQEIKRIQVQPILKEALKLLRSTIPTTISIEADIPETCPSIFADQTQIHQVVLNLMTNAFHAMEDSGGTLGVYLASVSLTSEEAEESSLSSGEYLKISITDTGVGMTPEVVEKIFDPFFTTRQNQKGTGLGLSMVHGIVTGYRGKISVESTPDKGTHIDVFLPAAGQMDIDKGVEATKPSMPGGNEHILLVDDEPAVLKVEHRIISRLGYQVSRAESGPEALALFRESPDRFDLVLTDMTMPLMTGDRLAEAVTEIRKDIPVVICTGFSDKVFSEGGHSAVVSVIHKPLVMTELAIKLREIFDGRHES